MVEHLLADTRSWVPSIAWACLGVKGVDMLYLNMQMKHQVSHADRRTAAATTLPPTTPMCSWRHLPRSRT